MDTKRHNGDPFAASFRMGTLRTGVWPTILVCAYCAVYFALSWDQPHRLALSGIIGAAFVATIAIALLPMEQIVRGAWREPFFVSWSGSLIALIAASTGLDGGVTSPMSSLFFLPLVYASLSYPFASMLLVGLMNLSAFLTVCAVTPVPSGNHVFVFSGALISATIICAWQAHNHARHREALALASRSDSLTGCLNRRGFQEALNAELARGRREGHDVGLLVIDLDDFKRVNDEHGHAAGDELLRWVADVLRGTLRAEEVVGRLGGDEFATILVGQHFPVALERVLATLAERAPASAGLARFPRDGRTPDELHAVADAEMYAHKRRRLSVADGTAPAR